MDSSDFNLFELQGIKNSSVLGHFVSGVKPMDCGLDLQIRHHFLNAIQNIDHSTTRKLWDIWILDLSGIWIPTSQSKLNKLWGSKYQTSLVFEWSITICSLNGSLFRSWLEYQTLNSLLTKWLCYWNVGYSDENIYLRTKKYIKGDVMIRSQTLIHQNGGQI